MAQETITQLPDSKIEIKGIIDWETLQKHEEDALIHFGTHLELDGFRKGNIPKDIVRKHLGDDLLLQDMAERAISAFYMQAIKDNTMQAIGKPSINITKIARGNSLEFTLTTAIIPQITLPDYKKIASSTHLEEAGVVTDEDVTKVVEELRELRAYGHVHAKDETHEHKEPLPEVDDAFAKTFGNFESVEAMRIKIKENLTSERTQQAKDKRRLNIMESLMDKTSIVVPDVLIQSEQETMIAQIESDIARAGHTLDAYLKETNMTREGLLEQYKPEAEKRAKVQLILRAIAHDAAISIPEAELIQEVDHIMKLYPGADSVRTKSYAEMILMNEKVLAMLEEEK